MASALVCLAVSGGRVAAASKDNGKILPTIHITSPLGRTGLPGRVRIVARLTTHTSAEVPPAVRFYVNGTLIATDAQAIGPQDGSDQGTNRRARSPREAAA